MKKSKKVLLLITLLLMFSCVFPVFAKNITSCESSIPGAIIDEKIPTTVSTIVTVIKIAVPVILVIFGMLDLFKGVMSQKEDEIKKSQQLFIKRLISGALVFFVFVIVQFIIGFVADAGDKEGMMDCVDCFINNDCTYDQNLTDLYENVKKTACEKKGKEWSWLNGKCVKLMEI